MQRVIANGVNMRLIRLASHSNIHSNPSSQHSAVSVASEKCSFNHSRVIGVNWIKLASNETLN
jgi:hypothetical protein